MHAADHCLDSPFPASLLCALYHVPLAVCGGEGAGEGIGDSSASGQKCCRPGACCLSLYLFAEALHCCAAAAPHYRCPGSPIPPGSTLQSAISGAPLSVLCTWLLHSSVVSKPPVEWHQLATPFHQVMLAGYLSGAKAGPGTSRLSPQLRTEERPRHPSAPDPCNTQWKHQSDPTGSHQWLISASCSLTLHRLSGYTRLPSCKRCITATEPGDLCTGRRCRAGAGERATHCRQA